MNKNLGQLVLLLCVVLTSHAAGQNHRWSTWSTWSSCSVSCDKGIRTRERRCSKITSSETSEIQGSFARPQQKPGCSGSRVDYEFCYPQECFDSEIDSGKPLKVTYQDSYRIRSEQCRAFDKNTYHGKTINWKPYMQAHLDMCKLYCQAAGHKFYAQLKKHVRDGTPCGKDYSKVCVEGKCQKRSRGCRTLDGPCVVDKIKKVIGVFNTTKLKEGYNFVATIPKGASDIFIEEITNSRSYLALRDHDSGNYTLNGHWRISFSKSFRTAGSEIRYTRNGNTKRGGETLKVVGPLKRSLDVMLIYQREPSHILYSFFVPEQVYEKLKLQPPKDGQHLFFPDPKKKPISTADTRAPVGEQQPISPNSSPVYPKVTHTQPLLPQKSSGATRGLWYGSSYVQFGGRPNNKGNTGQTSELKPQSAGKPSLLDQKIFRPNQFSYPNQDQSIQFGGPAYPQSKQQPAGGPPYLQSQQQQPASGYLQPQQQTSADSIQFGGSPYVRPQPQPPVTSTQFGDPGQAQSQPFAQYNNLRPAAPPGTSFGNPEGRSRFLHGDKQFYTSDNEEEKGTPSEVYVWRREGFTPCTFSCAGGIQSGLVRCVQSGSGQTVPDIKCNAELKPPEQRRVCNLQPCPAKWVPLEWQKCSRSCGEGNQIRDLLCKQVVDRNGEKISAMLPIVRCPVELRPDVIRKCSLKPCPERPKPNWVVGSWGRCSTECNHGLQKRLVTCKDYKNDTVDESKCASQNKPVSLKACFQGLCQTAWYSRSYWAKCSKACDSGIQSRPVVCARVDGSTLNEVYCSGKPKPEKVRTCNTPACTGVWMTSSWSECSADCGNGIQQRTVICMKHYAGRYRETNDQDCSLKDKPVVRKNCFIKECAPSWYATTWTKCSVTCDRGVQTRYVSCLNVNGTKVGGCKAWERPARRQRCQLSACPGQKHKTQTAPEPSCVDTVPKKNVSYCQIVKRLNFCRIPGYRRRCCKTCYTEP